MWKSHGENPNIHQPTNSTVSHSSHLKVSHSEILAALNLWRHYVGSCLCTEPCKYCQRPAVLFFSIHFNIILPPTYVVHVESFIHLSTSNPSTSSEEPAANPRNCLWSRSPAYWLKSDNRITVPTFRTHFETHTNYHKRKAPKLHVNTTTHTRVHLMTFCSAAARHISLNICVGLCCIVIVLCSTKWRSTWVSAVVGDQQQ